MLDPPGRDVAVAMRGIVKRFPGVLANDHISFQARVGEIHALLGENGAGKTTLMNILYGTYQPDEGEIYVNEKRVTIHSPRDAINRLLRVIPFSTRLIMALLIAFAQSQGCTGYLCIDDVVVPKPFAKKIPWVGWAYSSTEGKPIRGLHIVVVLWCCWPFKIPVDFRLWRSKDKCSTRHYRTKLELAKAMVVELLNAGVPFLFIAFDSWYNARWFTRFLSNCNVVWVSQLPCNSKVVYRNKKRTVSELAEIVKLKWRSHLEVRAAAIRVYLP